jgi:hypothetical protein
VLVVDPSHLADRLNRHYHSHGELAIDLSHSYTSLIDGDANEGVADTDWDPSVLDNDFDDHETRLDATFDLEAKNCCRCVIKE